MRETPVRLTGKLAWQPHAICALETKSHEPSIPGMATANRKGALIEYCSAHSLEAPSFKLIRARGPAHAPLFLVQCTVPPSFSTRSSEQPTKVAAEQDAAKSMIEILRKREFTHPGDAREAVRVDPEDDISANFVSVPPVNNTGSNPEFATQMTILNLCPSGEEVTYVAIPKNSSAAAYLLLTDKLGLRPSPPFTKTVVGYVRSTNAGQDEIGKLGGGAKKGDGPKTAEEIAAAKRARNQRRSAKRKAKKQANNAAAQPKPRGGGKARQKRRPRGAQAQLAVPQTLRSFVTVPGVLTPEEKILQSLATPELQKPERYPQSLNSKKTAIATPFTVIDTPWTVGPSADPTDNDGVGASTMYAFAFRNAMRALVYVDKNPGSQTSFYTAQVNEEGEGVSSIFHVPGSYTVDTFFDVIAPFMNVDPSHPYAPHGNVWYAGGDGDSQRTYYWLDNASYVLLHANGLQPTTQTISLRAIRWNDGIIEEDLAIVTDTADGTGTAEATWNPSDQIAEGTMGYFAFEVSTSAAQGNFTIDVTNADVHMAHRCLPDFERNFSSMLKTRILAVSLRYANTAAAAYRQGECTQYQAPKSIQWYHFINNINTMSKKSDSVTDTVINGAYQFLKPTQLSDFEFQADYELTDAFQMNMSHYPLAANSDYLALRMDIDPNITGTPTGQKGFFRVDYGIEFITDNIYFDIAHPEVGQPSFDKALHRLQDIPQYHENPMHLSNLWNYFLKGARGLADGVVRYAPAAAKIAQTAVPLLEGLTSLAL